MDLLSINRMDHCWVYRKLHDMNNKKWTSAEEEKVVSIYEKYKIKDGFVDISNIKRSELPPNRSIMAVKSMLYKNNIRCKGSLEAIERLNQPELKKKPKGRLRKSSKTVKITERSFLWGAYTFVTKES